MHNAVFVHLGVLCGDSSQSAPPPPNKDHQKLTPVDADREMEP